MAPLNQVRDPDTGIDSGCHQMTPKPRWSGVLRTYTMPRAYNLLTDPQERDNVLFPNTWVPKAALGQLEEHVASLRAYPPIPTGAADPYEPGR